MEGLNDVRIIRALYHSIGVGTFVQLNNRDRNQYPTADQTIQHPPTEEKPDLIDAASPGRGKL
jgi:glucose-fructose oxidoreductase